MLCASCQEIHNLSSVSLTRIEPHFIAQGRYQTLLGRGYGLSKNVPESNLDILQTL